MKRAPSYQTQLLYCGLLFCLFGGHALAADTSEPIKVLHPDKLGSDQLPAQRTALGKPGDYKPWLVRCSSGELLMVAFTSEGHNDPFRENAIFWRSSDGGRSWEPRREREDVHGREFAITCLADGTLLMSCHILPQDQFNQAGGRKWHSKLFRSTDHGHHWSEMIIGPKNFPGDVNAGTDRNVLEIPSADGSGKSTVLFGVSQGLTAGHTYLWRSIDSGQTWDRSFQPDTQGWDDLDGFYSNSVTYRAASGKLLHVLRVDATGKYWELPDVKIAGRVSNDGADRMMMWTSTDGGASWRRYGKFGTFGAGGEMYPRFLKLADGRLLLTFTVRSSSTDGHPLGLRAIVSYDDGDHWDFEADRLVLEQKNSGPSGGGFGNTIQLDDGGLVSCYSYRGVDDKTHVEVLRWRLPVAQ